MKRTIVILALGCLTVPAAGSELTEEAYRQNLTACISHSRSCRLSSLSVSDQDYLAFEVRNQRFSRAVVEAVVQVRMKERHRGGPVSLPTLSDLPQEQDVRPLPSQASGRPVASPSPSDLPASASTPVRPRPAPLPSP